MHKPTIIVSDPAHCACAHEMSIRPIQVEVTNLGQDRQVTNPGSSKLFIQVCSTGGHSHKTTWDITGARTRALENFERNQ